MLGAMFLFYSCCELRMESIFRFYFIVGGQIEHVILRFLVFLDCQIRILRFRILNSFRIVDSSTAIN